MPTTNPLPAGADVICAPQPGTQSLLMTLPKFIVDVLFGGARGGGKSYSILLMWLKHAGEYGESARGILFRTQQKQLREIHKEYSKVLKKLGCVFHEKHQEWTMPNGATLCYAYLGHESDADNYQGHGYTFVAIDEAGNFSSLEAIDKLWGSMRSGAGIQPIKLLTGNPGGVGHSLLKERYIDGKKPKTAYFRVRNIDAVGDEPQFYYYEYGSEIPEEYKDRGIWQIYIPSKITDNKKLLDSNPAYIANLYQTGSRELVKAWLEGDWDFALEGILFNQKTMHYYDKLPPLEEQLSIFQSWDCSATTKTYSDYSVCVTFGVYTTGIYIMDVFRHKLQFPDLVKAVVVQAKKWRCTDIIVENKSAGTQILQVLKRETKLPLRGFNPLSDKVTRAMSIANYIADGLVLFPKKAPWVRLLIDEMCLFPKGKHDDQVDALVQGLLARAKRYIPHLIVNGELYSEYAKQLSQVLADNDLSKMGLGKYGKPAKKHFGPPGAEPSKKGFYMPSDLKRF